MCLTLQRTGRTLYVKETADFACALAGMDGRFFAYPRSIGVSGFVGLECQPTIAAVAGACRRASRRSIRRSSRKVCASRRSS